MAEIIYLVMFCTEDCADTSVITWHVSCSVGAGDEYLVAEDTDIIVVCTYRNTSLSLSLTRINTKTYTHIQTQRVYTHTYIHSCILTHIHVNIYAHPYSHAVVSNIFENQSSNINENAASQFTHKMRIFLYQSVADDYRKARI